jgi:hypothetical protein
MLDDKKPTTKQINEFWAEVALMGWGTKGNYDAIKLALLQKWTPSKAKQMSNTCRFLRNRLDEKCRKVVKGLGDDGYGDLLSHIIGLGKEEYDRNMAEPKLAAARAYEYEFKECFSYCLPHKDDFKLLDPACYSNRMERVAKELMHRTQDKHLHPGARKPMLEVVRRLVDAVRKPLSLLEFEAEIRGNLEMVYEYDSGFNKWAVLNVVSDMGRYLAKAA